MENENCRSIVVITNYEKDEVGKTVLVTSHGIDEDFNSYVFPNVHPSELGAKFDITIGEWTLQVEDKS